MILEVVMIWSKLSKISNLYSRDIYVKWHPSPGTLGKIKDARSCHWVRPETQDLRFLKYKLDLRPQEFKWSVVQWDPIPVIFETQGSQPLHFKPKTLRQNLFTLQKFFSYVIYFFLRKSASFHKNLLQKFVTLHFKQNLMKDKILALENQITLFLAKTIQ